MATLRTLYEEREKLLLALKPIQDEIGELHHIAVDWLDEYQFQRNPVRKSLQDALNATSAISSLREKRDVLLDQLTKVDEAYEELLPKCHEHDIPYQIRKTEHSWEVKCQECENDYDLFDRDDNPTEEMERWWRWATDYEGERSEEEDIQEETPQHMKSLKFEVAIQLAGMDEPFLDPELKKLILEWKSLPEDDHSLKEYKRRVEKSKGFPLYEPPKDEPKPWLAEELRKKIMDML